CVHCGLCAERCPTAAWDMQKSHVHWPHAGDVPEPAPRRGERVSEGRVKGDERTVEAGV
ncbi:MAG: 4Fe-4S binding protein, partial [Pseudomonadota bacterium]